MIPTYGIHPAHDIAHAANELRHAVRELYESEATPDVVGLATVADMMDTVAGAIDRHWWTARVHLQEQEQTA